MTDHWDPPFQTARFLVCDLILWGQGDELGLLLIEHHPIAGDASVTVGNTILGGLTMVGESPESRKWLVYWRFAAAFKIFSESFNFTVPAIPGPPGRCFRGPDSNWLTELRVGGLLDDLHPGCQHFVVLTDHKTLEIVSPDDPLVQQVTEQDFDLVEWLEDRDKTPESSQ
jgi:hypothetical protein